MIFYFTASGNSQAAAEQLAEGLGERLISIGLALRDGQYAYDLGSDKVLGFVVPTFAYTLPGAVARFIEKLELKGYAGQYTFGVFTCGAASGDEGAALRQALLAKGLGWNGSFDVVMPDNFILWTPLPGEERLAATRAAARKRIDGILAHILAGENGTITEKAPKMPYMPLEKISTAAGTSKLHATDKCVGCGACANVCPMSCVKLVDHAPAWEGECCMCLACLHHCPQGAVEYADQTAGKRRYLNPDARPRLKNVY